jgi:hypothetical protein
MTHQPRASFQSPRFAHPATFVRLPHPGSHGLDVAIVGVPRRRHLTAPAPGSTARDPRPVVADPAVRYFRRSRRSIDNVADIGDIDAPPVVSKCYDVVTGRLGAIAAPARGRS